MFGSKPKIELINYIVLCCSKIKNGKRFRKNLEHNIEEKKQKRKIYEDTLNSRKFSIFTQKKN